MVYMCQQVFQDPWGTKIYQKFDPVAAFILLKNMSCLNRDLGACKSPKKSIYWSRAFHNFFGIHNEIDFQVIFNISNRINDLDHDFGANGNEEIEKEIKLLIKLVMGSVVGLGYRGFS